MADRVIEAAGQVGWVEHRDLLADTAGVPGRAGAYAIQYTLHQG